jgi:hypothetical protein
MLPDLQKQFPPLQTVSFPGGMLESSKCKTGNRKPHFILLSFFFFFFFETRSLHSFVCPGTHYVDQAGLILNRDHPAS